MGLSSSGRSPAQDGGPMIARYPSLARHPKACFALTGRDVPTFDALADDMLPRIDAALRRRRDRPGRRRAPGAGHPFDLDPRDRLLLTIVGLRRDPTYDPLGCFFGVAKAIVCRAIA